MRPALDSRATLSKSSLTDVFEVSRLLTFAALKNVSISVWRDTPTMEALQRVDPHVTKIVAKYPKIASVIVMESLEFRAPDPQARAEHGRLTKKYEDKTTGVAMIVDGNSARHSVYRFVLSTMTLLSAPTVTQKIFQSPVGAAGWLATCDDLISKSDLVEAIREARALTY
jgi:hypothetical protein